VDTGSVDGAIPALFKIYEATQQKEQETRQQLKIKETTEILQKSFALLDKAVIDEVVTRCGGDMETAAQEIMRLIKLQEEEDERRLRDVMEEWCLRSSYHRCIISCCISKNAQLGVREGV